MCKLERMKSDKSRNSAQDTWSFSKAGALLGRRNIKGAEYLWAEIFWQGYLSPTRNFFGRHTSDERFINAIDTCLGAVAISVHQWKHFNSWIANYPHYKQTRAPKNSLSSLFIWFRQKFSQWHQFSNGTCSLKEFVKLAYKRSLEYISIDLAYNNKKIFLAFMVVRDKISCDFSETRLRK